MNNKGQFEKVSAVRFTRRLPGPVDRVWEYLTDTNLLREWYGAGKIEPAAGGELSLMDGHIRGTVTQWHPNELLVYTWNVFSPGQTRSDYPESYLTQHLTVEGEDVVLSLTHFPVLERFEPQNAMGWHTYLDLVEAGVRGETLPSRNDLMPRNAELYGVDLQNLVR